MHLFRINVFTSYILAVIMCPWLIPSARAQLTVVQGSAMNMTPLQLVQNYLVGSGVTVSNATFNGSPTLISSNLIGTFATAGGATTQLGLLGGILMTSGKASLAIGPNSNTGAGFNANGTGDPDLNILSGSTTFDKAVLEFDFVPQFDTVRFRYVFGSEEFMEYCGSYNDAFGFFLSGPGIAGTFSNNAINIALMPGTNDYVTINNICDNPNSRWTNPPGGLYYQYDALTHVFRAWAVVQPCSTYHIKLAIADAVDHALDSGVFLEKNSFSSPGLSMSNDAAIPALGNLAVEGCNDVLVSFKLTSPLGYSYHVHYTILGTATNGTDYTHIPDSVVFPPGHDSVSVLIHPILDLVPEGNETVILRLNQISCNGTVQADTIVIADYIPISMQPLHDTTMCYGGQIVLSAVPSGGHRPFQYTWNIQPQNDSVIILTPPVGTNNYHVTITDICNYEASDTAIVTVHPVPVADAGPDVTIANGTSTVLHGNASGGYGNYSYSWTSNPPGFTSSEQNPSTGNLSGSKIYELTITDLSSGCQSVPDEVIVYIQGGPLSVNPVVEPDTVCIGNPAQLHSLAGGGSGIYTYTWTSDPPGFTSSQPDPEITPETSTTYFLTVNDGFNQMSGNTQIKVNPLPVIYLGPTDTVVCVYDTVTLDAGNPGSAYLWSNGETTRKIMFMATGIGYEVQTYTVHVTNTSSCSDSATINVVFSFDACSGVANHESGPDFEIIPNPTAGNFRLSLDPMILHPEIEILNLLGQVVFRQRPETTDGRGNEYEIHATFLPGGLYIVRVTGEHFSGQKKLLIR
jgi:hypothetical protein